MFLIIPFTNKITNSQIYTQKQIGLPSVNEALYNYKYKNGIEGKIITDYYWVTALPGFNGSSIKVFNENDNFVIISNSDSY